MVAGAIKVYSWKNQTRTLGDFRESLEKFLERNLTFSVKSMENLWVIKQAKPAITGKSKKAQTYKPDEKVRKLAYYYISKLLKKGIIRKTDTYECQRAGEKSLMIYEVVK